MIDIKYKCKNIKRNEEEIFQERLQRKNWFCYN